MNRSKSNILPYDDYIVISPHDEVDGRKTVVLIERDVIFTIRILSEWLDKLAVSKR